MSIVFDFKSIANVLGGPRVEPNLGVEDLAAEWNDQAGKKQSTILWLKFSHGPAFDMRWTPGARYPTFESYKQDLIRGWTSGGQPEQVSWLVQDEEPAPDAKWNCEWPTS